MEVNTNNVQKMAFRIVKDRWYHNIFDRVANLLPDNDKDTSTYYQIHLSAELKKKKDKWILSNSEHIKTKEIIPEASFHRQFAKQMEDSNSDKIISCGYEIDMSHVMALEERLSREEKNIEETKENDTKEKTIPNLECISDINDVPIDVLLKMCSDPKMMERVIDLNPSIDVLEAMIYEVLEKIQILKQHQFLKEKENISEAEKKEKSPPEYIYL